MIFSVILFWYLGYIFTRVIDIMSIEQKPMYPIQLKSLLTFKMQILS
jgi:hypothetical protein